MDKSQLVATLVVLVISAMAFMTGSLQDNYTTLVLQEKGTVQILKDDLERMESWAYYILNRDVTRVREYGDLLSELYLLDAEFELLNDSFSIEERNLYVRKTVDTIIQLQGYQNDLLILHLYRHFNQTSDTYYIAQEDNEGYDFFISEQMWQSFQIQHGSPVTVMTPEQYYGSFFAYDSIQALPEGLRPNDPETGAETFIIESAGVEFFSEFFLLSQVQSLQSEINAKMTEVSLLESEIDRISSSVGLITVAMLLATVMSSRIDDKKLENQITSLRTELGKDARVEKDTLSLPILLIALLLAAFGVYLMLF